MNILIVKAHGPGPDTLRESTAHQLGAGREQWNPPQVQAVDKPRHIDGIHCSQTLVAQPHFGDFLPPRFVGDLGGRRLCLRVDVVVGSAYHERVVPSPVDVAVVHWAWAQCACDRVGAQS